MSGRAKRGGAEKLAKDTKIDDEDEAQGKGKGKGRTGKATGGKEGRQAPGKRGKGRKEYYSDYSDAEDEDIEEQLYNDGSLYNFTEEQDLEDDKVLTEHTGFV